MPLIEENPSLLSYQRQRLRRILRRKRPLEKYDQSIKATFAGSQPTLEGFATVTEYFWHAYKHYVDDWGTLAYYPGWPSIYGAASDAVEGVSRTMPLWAAFSTSSLAKDRTIRLQMFEAIRRALLNGTNPKHPGYWGNIGDRSTLICEAADIALSVWLIKDTFWSEFYPKEQDQVLSWLGQAVGKKTADNNWHLFVVLVDAVVTDLDPRRRFTSHDRYQRITEMYIGDGCFRDGPAGSVDFYNAWAFHYAIFWLEKISPELVEDLALPALRAYVAWYKYLFTERGFPLFGRSLCYRLAAPVPLIAAADREIQSVEPEVALSALWACWRFFISEGALAKGRPTQGVFGDDRIWLDPYSGPASAFWGTRSLVLLYYTARSTDWSRAMSLSLPACRGESTLYVPAAGFTLKTQGSTGITEIQICEPRSQEALRLSGQTLKERLKQLLYAQAVRPANNLQRKGICHFDSILDIYRA